jgi:hypothetical protein
MKPTFLLLLLASLSSALEAPQVEIQATCDGYNTTVTLSWQPVAGAFRYDLFEHDPVTDEQTISQTGVHSPLTFNVPTGWDWQNQDDVCRYYSIVAIANPLIGDAFYPLNGNTENAISDYFDCTAHGLTYDNDRNGVSNSCAKFDGINDYALMQNSISNSPMSVCFWFRLDNDASVRNMMILRHRPHGYVFQFYPQNGVLKFWAALYVSGGSQRYDYISPGGEFADHDWHFCALTYDESVFRVYMDGDVVSEQSQYGANNQVYYSPGVAAFGRDGDVSDKYYDGYLDDVRFYTREISFEEVNLLFNDR